MGFTETNYENSILELLQQDLGYAISHGPDIIHDYKNPLFEEDLTISITRINKDLQEQAINEALDKLRNIDAGTLIQKNQKFTDYLQNGIPVTYYSGTEEQNTIVRLIDYNTPKNNTYRAINQWTVIDYETRRPDIVIFINGIPLVVVELKSPSREETDASEGIPPDTKLHRRHTVSIRLQRILHPIRPVRVQSRNYHCRRRPLHGMENRRRQI